jgi:sulfur-oxidizing protein SoxY
VTFLETKLTLSKIHALRPACRTIVDRGARHADFEVNQYFSPASGPPMADPLTIRRFGTRVRQIFIWERARDTPSGPTALKYTGFTMNTFVRSIYLKRRHVLKWLGVAVAVGACPALAAGPAVAGRRETDAAIRRIIGNRKPKMGRIKLDVHLIVEDGGSVPLAVQVESPMTATDYVKAVHLFADENPQPELASYYFTPRNGRASVATRVRLAKSQNIIALAEMSNGDLYMAKTEVKVTIGGCGAV